MSALSTQPSPAWAGEFEARVDALTQGLAALAVLLVRERDALSTRTSAADLDDIADDKRSAVANVASLYALLRSSISSAWGDGTPLDGAVSLLRDSHPGLARRVSQLVDITRECHLANQENGVLVHARLDGARSALTALDEACAGGVDVPALTYGPEQMAATQRAGSNLTLRA